MKVHMLSETVAFRPYDFLIDVSSGPWDYGLPGSARCIDCLNAKYPNGIEAQKEKLEAEGHTIIQKGRKNIRYYVKDYENSLFDLK